MPHVGGFIELAKKQVCEDCESTRKSWENLNEILTKHGKEEHRLNAVLDTIFDRLRDSLITNSQLRLLLHEKNIAHDF